MPDTFLDAKPATAAVQEPAQTDPKPELNGHEHQPVPLHMAVALLAIVGIGFHLVLRFIFHASPFVEDIPLGVILVVGGGLLLWELALRVIRRQFGSDLLAGISIIVAVILHEYLAGSLVVLMLAGGTALEAYAMQSASSVLRALARRMPSVAHRRRGDSVEDIAINAILPGDHILLFPHETCPADARVIKGQGHMDESYLTGEPYGVPKTPGSEVLSGAINGEVALELEVLRAPADSRYEAIMRVMRDAEQRKPKLRRIADRLGAWYTPAAVFIAALAWYFGGPLVGPTRFLAVLVVATPCPLIIAIPVALIGTISLAARRGIVIRDPAVLERIDTCQTVFFDKTGTLTYGRPRLIELLPATDFEHTHVLGLVATLEQYSRHPLAQAVVIAAREQAVPLSQATDVSEPPGQGLTGQISGHKVVVTGRSKIPASLLYLLPPAAAGLECIVLIDGRYAATLCFRDEPRDDVTSFVSHLAPRHHMQRTILLTGDQEEEARRMAAHAGITQVFSGKSPEQKLQIVREETARTRTLYLGDGVNDAPAMLAATAAIAFGAACDVTSETAGAVILEPSLHKLDELLHIAARLRHVALTAAIGGMALSIIAIGFAAAGFLPPVAGALFQELIDLAAVLYALRAAFPPRALSHL